MLIYSFPLLIAGFAGMINETLDRAILKYLVPDRSSALQQLGIYSACYKLSILMSLFVQTFRYAAEPFFFSRQKSQDNRQLLATIMNYFVFAGCLIFLIVMLYINFVKNFIGHNFYSGLHVVPVLLLANLFLGIYLYNSMWYKLSGTTRYGAWFSVVGAIITIILNFWWIPVWGYTGAAWATLVCYGTMMIISYVYGNKIYPIPYQLNKVALFILLAITIWIMNKCLNSVIVLSPLYEVLFSTLSLAAYIGIVWKPLRSSGSININT